jgi:iron-sulfur cluster repair protein YtfE (RIC family)
MTALTQELKAQHQWLVAQLTSVRKNTGAPDAHETLRSIQKGLLAHLQKEDGNLYPRLAAAGEKDPKVREINDMFGSEMKRIATVAVAFFDRYVQPGATSSSKFITDLDELVKVLAARISSEEMVLYPTYDRVAFDDPEGVVESTANDGEGYSAGRWLMIGAALLAAGIGAFVFVR